jgi:nucleoside-diphosphate-sugar epimerase
MLIHLGSSLEYGPRTTPHRESDPLEPSTFRGRVKARATQLSREFAEKYGREVVTLRPFSVYGPFEPPSRFIPAALRAASRGTTLPLTLPGIRRDFVFVGDVVEACLRAAALEGWRGEALNVGTGREWSNEEVVEAIRASLGVTLEVEVGRYPRRDVDTEHWCADTTLSARTLGWTPPTGLHDGLRLTESWLREHS